MNKSPNSLKEIIRINNSDLNEINIVGYNGMNYTTESGLLSFMEEYEINDKDSLIQAIKESNNITTLDICNESVADSEVNFINEVMMIYENIHTIETVNAAKGTMMLKMYIDQACAFIMKNHYDQAVEIERYIRKCDDILDDIETERQLAKEKGKTSDYKFSLYYIYNIAKSVFMIFFAPLMLKKVNIHWPSAVTKLFKSPKGTGEVVKKVVSNNVKKKVGGYIIQGISLGSALPPDLEGLYLSFKDYDSLLAIYEAKIKSVKIDLNNKLRKIEMSNKGENSMFELKEAGQDPEATKVNFQMPEDLRIKGVTPEIVHDDDSQKLVVPAPVENISKDPEPMEVIQPKEIIPVEEPEAAPPIEFTPCDALRQAKGDPCNVVIAKYKDKYYIDHNDLKCFMDSCGETKYETALENIVKAHDDSKLCKESMIVIMGENDLLKLDSEEKEIIENSSIKFEVYSGKH